MSGEPDSPSTLLTLALTEDITFIHMDKQTVED